MYPGKGLGKGARELSVVILVLVALVLQERIPTFDERREA